MQASEIEDHKSFERWLNQRPKGSLGWEAASLSWRIAARSLTFTLVGSVNRSFDNLLKASLWPTAIARAMTLAPDRAVELMSFALSSSLFIAISAAHSASLSAAASAHFASINSAEAAAYSAASLRTAESALLAAAYATWPMVQADCAFIESDGWQSLIRQPLWPASVEIPPLWQKQQSLLREALRHIPNQHVWLRWHDRVLSGQAASDEVEGLYCHPEVEKLLEQPDGFDEATAWIAARLAEIEAREGEPPNASPNKPKRLLPDLATLGSPIAIRKPNGKIGLGPNPIYDALDVPADGMELVAAQASIIRTIESGLPTEAPQHLRTALTEYSSALPAYEKAGMALTLDVQFPVIVREIRETKDREWIEKGLLVACKTFQKQHPSIIKFARDHKKREAIIAAIPFNEAASDTPELRASLKTLDAQLLAAVEAGIAEPEVQQQVARDIELFDVLRPMTHADRFQPASDGTSPRKRWLLTRIGFFKTLKELTSVGGGITAMLKDGKEALSNLWQTVDSLLKLLKNLFYGL